MEYLSTQTRELLQETVISSIQMERLNVNYSAITSTPILPSNPPCLISQVTGILIAPREKEIDEASSYRNFTKYIGYSAVNKIHSNILQIF